MQRTCSSHSCTCPADTVGRCGYYGPHSFREGTPFPHGSFPQTPMDPHGCDPYNNGGTYPPDPYMAPETIQEIRAQRAQCAKRGITSTICISTIVMFITVGIAVAMIG